LVLWPVMSVACASPPETRSQGTGSGREAPVEVVQTGLLPFFATIWPTVIAKSEGFFEEQGLDVSFIWGYEGTQIFAGGKADVLLESSESGLLLRERGLDVVAFYPLATRITSWLVAQKNITSPAQLAGTTIGVSGIPSTDQYLAIKFLEGFGVSESDVDYLKIQRDLAPAALESGNVEAAIFDEVLAKTASAGGKFNVLAQAADFGPYPWTILHAEQSWLDEHPDATKGYVTAVYQATQFILDPANKQAVIDAISEESGGGAVDEASLSEAYDLVVSTPDYFSAAPLTDADLAPAVEALKFTDQLGEGQEPDTTGYLEMALFEEAVG